MSETHVKIICCDCSWSGMIPASLVDEALTCDSCGELDGMILELSDFREFYRSTCASQEEKLDELAEEIAQWRSRVHRAEDTANSALNEFAILQEKLESCLENFSAKDHRLRAVDKETRESEES